VKDNDCAYITRFKDKESLEAYYPHPYHSELINKYIRTGIVFIYTELDLEVETAR
jgi:hypothetical protein